MTGPQTGAVPAVDIVLATNRAGRFFAQTLASVSAQKGVSWRLTVVDDGSPGPAEIRAAVANLANTTVVRQSAAGLSAARNRGLREGAAPFIAFLDDDDFWAPTRCLAQARALVAAPDAVMSSCDGHYVDADGEILGSWDAVGDHSRHEYFSGDAPLPRIPTLLYRRDATEAVGGFDPTMHLVEDHDFNLRMLMRGGCVAVSEPLVHYRMHDANVSLAPGAEVEARRNLARMYRKLIRLCEAQGRAADAAALRHNFGLRRRDWALRSARQISWATRNRSIAVLRSEGPWLLTHGAWLAAAAPDLAAHLARRRG